MDIRTALGQEWSTLQNNYERYENSALIVKLVATVLLFGGVALSLAAWVVCLLVLVLWLQEGILKTYQARLGERLLWVEQQVLAGPHAEQAFQLHSAWLAQRKGTVGLVSEYLVSACRPTVAFPYVVLFVVGLGLPFPS